MADRKKQKKKKEEMEPAEDDKPTKEQYAVAKYLKSNLPSKKTTLLGHKVEYFIASKAVDALLDSPWASGSKKTPIIFTDRASIETYLDIMLQRKFFHRAKKIVQRDPNAKKGKKKDDDTADEKKSGKEDKEEKPATDDSKENESDKKKKKRKVKLDMHLEQLFIDGSDAYVWIYDPIPMRAWLIGALIVFGSIALCLFPLWPASIRLGVYYLSVVAAAFLVILLGLAVVRLILFAIIWGASMGKHHFWLLPNLMEDVGFFESFWPLYFYEYRGEDKKNDDKQPAADKSKSKKEVAEPIEEKEDSASDQNPENDGFEVVEKEDLSETEKDGS